MCYMLFHKINRMLIISNITSLSWEHDSVYPANDIGDIIFYFIDIKLLFPNHFVSSKEAGWGERFVSHCAQFMLCLTSDKASEDISLLESVRYFVLFP